MHLISAGYRFLMLLVLLLTLVSCKGSFLGDDIRLFRKVQALANAVATEDLGKIKEIISDQPTLLNYQEPRFGQTLLIWSILNDRYKSAEKLLQLGADPNLQNHDGLSALMYAAEWSSKEWKGNPKYLKLVLRYGGDPNAIAKPISPPARLQTPLISAVNSLSLDNVKIIINAGADPNYIDGCKSALVAAFDLGQIDIVHYLIIEKKIDVHTADCKTLNGDTITVLSQLRNMVYPLGSREHKVKMEVVQYLKSQGLDYNQEPVPKHFYKIYDENFLEKY
ncbi:ankyrin repeat domain-containing protein [Geotalea sp. SG265]|uniref:ankyrin repeat domain-containing protein n=1 Tax=Geotalea sp. SG265 TaxID=2922867 RepID=UPI001FAF5FB2|nr:ankyrin repeat domain-containing protein [Geotalea sp. SG265]